MADRSEGVRRGAGRAVLAALLPRPYSAALPRGRSMEDPIQRPTPLLRWRGALLKLESLPPSGTVHALRTRWPKVRAIALTAADKELPELPREDEFPGAETRAISFSEASRARSDLARSAGVLASHAAAAAAAVAGEGGLAIVTAAGERGFSPGRTARPPPSSPAPG